MGLISLGGVGDLSLSGAGGSGGIHRTSMGLRRLRLTRFRVHAIVPGRIGHDEIEGVRRQVAEGPHVGEEPHPATQ